MHKLLMFLFLVLISIFLNVQAFPQENETIAIATYYPSPLGIYEQLVAQTLGVGDNNDDGSLNGNDAPDPNDAAQAGNVWIHGRVGINTTTPQTRLEVNNTFMITPQASNPSFPSGTPEGALYYNSAGTFKYYDGSSWKNVGAASLGAEEQKIINVWYGPTARDLKCSTGYVATKIILYTDNRCIQGERMCDGRCHEAGEIHRIGLVCKKLQ